MRSAPASPHLDMRNVMWLLAAMAFVVAPHLLRMPYWVSGFFLAIVAWRAWIAWAALHFPAFLLSVLICGDALTWLTMLYQPEISGPSFGELNSGLSRWVVVKQ